MFIEGVRSLRAAPGVTLFILAILTSTIAAATVTFSVVDAVVLRPLPFDRSNEPVAIDHQRGDRVMSQARAVSALQFLALRERTDAVGAMAAVARAQQVLQTGGEPERIASARVTASLFEVLRTKPLMGDVFNVSHEVAGNDRVAVISHGLWRRHFGGDVAVDEAHDENLRRAILQGSPNGRLGVPGRCGRPCSRRPHRRARPRASRVDPLAALRAE